MINNIITKESVKHSGKPRMTVYDVLSYLASGMTHEQILHDFPALTEDDILTCLNYAPDVHTFLFG